jgi:adenosylcobalamin-dependent ribonucleoside-diphosphate reductase
MSEQQKQASQGQVSVQNKTPQDMTQLEGIRQKVFMDRYSLKDASGQPLEFYPEQTWARVARGIAAVETTEENRAYWEKRFYEALSNFQFVPGGRILAGAGTGHQVTFYNCLSGDTLVHTREGLVPIGTLQGEHEVLSEGGVYRRAFFKSYGKQQLWEVTLANGTTIYATGDHQWVVNKEKGGTERVVTRDLAGRQIPINPRPVPEDDSDFSEGVRHGIVYGDGSVQYGEAHVCLLDEKETLASWFSSYRLKESGGTVATREHIRIQGLPAEWKELPSRNASATYWRGFVAGLIATNGHVDERGSVMLHNRDKEVLRQIVEGMAIAGLVASSITMAREFSPYNGEEKSVYRLQFFKATVNQHDILHPLHLKNFLESPQARHSSIRAESVKETNRFEEVFCCVEPETHTITISHGYLTGQCFVIPSPEDSRQGILDNLKIMTEIMARGGGVGINLSTLRPRGSYIKTVNGTASGPCSWAQLYSVATGDVIQQGGSRRGALMLMLDDTHPDIEEFITVKRTPGKIEHANLSVCVSDKFMQAVKDDANWDLIWQGEVKKTVRARHLWDLICTSAWESAEPGVVFMDRYNKESNTWYYENIRCVNPCGEQGLPPWGVCNLGALNLSAFVENGKMDWRRLAEVSKIAMRFLDNVVDANEYFIKENEEAQLSTRRTGLGTMGLADALIKMKIAYGSDESLPVIERIYATIRDAAYEASSDIAVEKGPFPHFERDKYMQGRFIQCLPQAIQDKIYKQGIRNAVLLTQAPTGTTSLLAGISSGIEPVYDFAMVRRDRTGEHILYHPLLQEWRDKHPNEPTPHYFVSSKDLTPEEHVRVQAMVQKYTDSSISKTVNAPNNHTVEQVQTLYRLAYEMGCKGVTYYRDGSRDAVLTRVEDEKKATEAKQAPMIEPVTSIHQGVKPRPSVVQGYTRQMSAPEGKIYITINSDEQGPLEVFVTVGKAGSDIAALADALGRLISLNLRILSPLSQSDRVQEIVDQLRGIGGSRSVGFGMQQIRSLPDGVARALELHLESLQTKEEAPAPNQNGNVVENNKQADPPNPLSLSTLTVTGNLCPQCGCNTMVYEEGCRKCYSCGHSEC